jgi:hypothetical protein
MSEMPGKTDLSGLYGEIKAAAAQQGLLVFPGYIGEELPAVWWQGDPDDWLGLLMIAKAEGVHTIFLGRAVLAAEDLQDLADWVEENAGPGSTNGDRARIKEFERFIGSTGEVRLAYIKDGIAFLLQQRTEWYDEFLELVAESQEEEEDLEDLEPPE